jgi:hypothetical protein
MISQPRSLSLPQSIVDKLPHLRLTAQGTGHMGSSGSLGKPFATTLGAHICSTLLAVHCALPGDVRLRQLNGR